MAERIIKWAVVIGGLTYSLGWAASTLASSKYGLVSLEFNHKYIIAGALFIFYILTPPLLVIISIWIISSIINVIKTGKVDPKDENEEAFTGRWEKWGIVALMIFFAPMWILIMLSLSMNAWSSFLGPEANSGLLQIYRNNITFISILLWFALAITMHRSPKHDGSYNVLWTISLLFAFMPQYANNIQTKIDQAYGGNMPIKAAIQVTDKAAQGLQEVGFKVNKELILNVIIYARDSNAIYIGNPLDQLTTSTVFTREIITITMNLPNKKINADSKKPGASIKP